MIVNQIIVLCKNEKVKVTNLEAEIGASKGVLSRAIAHKTDIQSKWVTKIVEKFPQYNPMWLLTGTGEMLINTNGVSESKEKTPLFPVDNQQEKVFTENSIYLVEPNVIKSFCGFLQSGANMNELKMPTIKIPNTPKGLNVAFQIFGDDMYPTISHSSLVMGNFIYDKKNIREGYPYIIIDGDGEIVCKRLYKQGNDWKLISDNPMYQPYVLPSNDLLFIFRLFGKLSYDFGKYNNGTQAELTDMKTTLKSVIDQNLRLLSFFE